MNIKIYDIYQLFELGPSHVIDIGISSELESVRFAKLGNKSLMPSSHKTTSWSYHSNGTAILKACNDMLKQIRSELNTLGLIHDFSSCDRSIG